VSERTTRIERDMCILLQSVSPKEAAVWIADKRDAMDDAEFRAIYLEYDAAFDWSTDDQRLRALADRTARWIANRRARLERREWPVPDPAVVQLIATAVGETSPAWDYLAEIAKELRAG
jgi:hypothetical protein